MNTKDQGGEVKYTDQFVPSTVLVTDSARR